MTHTSNPPPFPGDRPRTFRTTVHGTVFGDRGRHVDELSAGAELTLIPDPPVRKDPGVWVHVASGEPVGHLPPEIAEWLAPWLQEGGRATARVLRVKGKEAPSWARLLLEVSCE